MCEKKRFLKDFRENWYKGWVDPGALLNDALLLVSNFLGEFWGPTINERGYHAGAQ